MVSTERRGLSVLEVAGTLGVSTATIRRSIERGEIPAVRIGKRRRVIPSVFLARLLETAQDCGAATGGGS
jgi:excisionase family DNA binding protein